MDEGTAIERLCEVVEMQSAIIKAQHETIRQLGGVDPTEQKTEQTRRKSRELCGNIFDV